jgi:HlyD family secretion protein
MNLSRFVKPRHHENSPDRLIRLFQSETAEISEGLEPLRLRLPLYALAALFASLLVIMTVTQIDRVVNSVAGVVVTTDPTVVLQALDPSIIKTIDVQEGDRVKGGQLLATLDATLAAADVSALRLQIASLEAQISRCEAELARLSFDAPEATSSAARAYGALQKSYYSQRQAQFDAQIRANDEQIAQIRATIAKLQNDQARYDDRAKISAEIEAMRASLAASQFGSRLNLLTATDQRLEILRTLEFDRNSLIESEHQLAAAVSNKDAFIQQWFGQVSQELLTARNSLDNAREQLAKAIKHEDLVRLEAPEDAVVLKLAKLSVGSVLKQGDPLINLAPLRSPIEAEVHIAARDVGFVRPGDATILKLDAFNFVEHGTAEGKVRWISEGAFSVDDNNNPVDPYYKARIALTTVELRDVPESFRLIPGMTLTADIQIGTRSVFMYLVRGLVRGINEAMREP